MDLTVGTDTSFMEPHADGGTRGMVVKRWTRYGKDRLYVSTITGERVGWADLTDGLRTIERPDLADGFADVIDSWHEAEGAKRLSPWPAPVSSAATTAGVIGLDNGDRAADHLVPGEEDENDSSQTQQYGGGQEDQGPPAQMPWEDLSARHAGQMARQRADELRRQAPVRTFVARMFDVHNDERAWRVGASGEETVGRQLRRLPPGWQVVHAVPVGERGSDIDHVVVGTGGVFTLNTKHHPGGRVWVAERMLMLNGHRTDYLRNALFEAKRARRLLSAACGFEVEVWPVLVVVAADLTIRAQPVGVFVLDGRTVTNWLSRCPHRLSADTVETIFEHARRSTTWHH